MLVAILAAFLTVGFASHDVMADGSSSSSNDDWHSGGACNNWARISKGAATCLAAGWDNSPPVSAGVGIGSTYWARNDCSDYGDIKAHIDLKAREDEHMHLNDGSKINGKDSFADVRQISCCVNKSYICFKEEVEPITSGEWVGHIKMIAIDGNSYSEGYGEVATQSERYLLCQHWAHIPYCQLDPEGDAFIHPDVIAAEIAAAAEARQPGPGYREHIGSAGAALRRGGRTGMRLRRP